MSSFWNDTKETVSALYETAVDEVKSVLEIIRDTWPLIILLIAVLVGIFAISNPPPPKRIVMSTGSEGSSLQMMAQKYAASMAKKGIQLDLVNSFGSEENAKRILDPNSEVQLAFVASGIINTEEAKHVISLGSVEFEPLWLFYRSNTSGTTDQSIQQLFNKKVSIGPEGSATHFFALKILALNKMDRPEGFVNMTQTEAVSAIEAGDIDGMFIIDSIGSKNVQKLISNPDLQLSNFVRAKAYTKALPYLERLEIDQGALDLARNFPSQHTEILATTVLLVAKETLHPALQMLLLEAAKEVNGKESFFAKRGEFPSYKDSSLPESNEARIYYEKGPPLLMQYLPFWLAEFIHRMIFILLPFAIVAYPIVLSLPDYRLKRIRGRITRAYGDLKALEQDIIQSPPGASYDGFKSRLDEIEKYATSMKVPKSIASDYFSLRTTIDFVRGTLEKLTS